RATASWVIIERRGGNAGITRLACRAGDRGAVAEGLVNDPWAPDGLGLHPVFVDDRPEHLIQVLAVLEERSPEHAFLHGADLSRRAIAAAVPDRRARLDSMYAHHLEREFEHELRPLEKEARAPVGRPDREAPLRPAEPGLERPDLEKAN